MFKVPLLVPLEKVRHSFEMRDKYGTLGLSAMSRIIQSLDTVQFGSRGVKIEPSGGTKYGNIISTECQHRLLLFPAQRTKRQLLDIGSMLSKQMGSYQRGSLMRKGVSCGKVGEGHKTIM